MHLHCSLRASVLCKAYLEKLETVCNEKGVVSEDDSLISHQNSNCIIRELYSTTEKVQFKKQLYLNQFSAVLLSATCEIYD